MALVDVNRIVQVPGRLAISATSFGTFPGGGTSLGAVRSILAFPKVVHKEVPNDVYGPEPTEVIYIGSRWSIVVTFRGFDPDAISTVFPNVTAAPAGRASSSKTLVHPGTKAPGYKRSADAIPLTFWPDDPQHMAVHLYRAIPIVDPATAFVFERGTDFEFTASFVAIRRASDGLSAVAGLLEVLTA